MKSSTAAYAASAAAATSATSTWLSHGLRSVVVAIMDIHFYLHRWILCVVVAVLLHQCQDVQVMADSPRACPQGQVIHPLPSQATVACCQHVSCGIGHEVKPCTINGTHDTCEPCPPYSNISERTSSFTMDKKCIPWHLDDDCAHQVTGVIDYNSPLTQRCMCNVELGVMYRPLKIRLEGAPKHANCIPINNPCDPGKEPDIRGRCFTCKEKHFKSKIGFRLCEPKTNCTQLGLMYTYQSDSPILNNNCSEPQETTTPRDTTTTTATATNASIVAVKPPVTQPPKTVAPSTTTTASQVKIGSSTSAKDGEGDEPVPVWAIVGPALCLLFIVLLICLILFLRRHRKMPSCNCLGLKSNDMEKYTNTQCPSNLPAGDLHLLNHNQHYPLNKNGPTIAYYPDSHQHPHLQHQPHPHTATTLTGGEKVLNNNINGGLIHNGIDSPRGPNMHRPYMQQNGGVGVGGGGGNFVQFSGTDSSDSETQQVHFQNQQNSFQANGVVGGSSRHPSGGHHQGGPLGILRNGNKSHQGQQIRYVQAATRPQEVSMDSIGREKLHVNIDGSIGSLGRGIYQANQDIGENDPLLIAAEDSPGGVGVGTVPVQGVIFQNGPRPAGGGGMLMSTNHSPPLVASTASQMVYLPHHHHTTNFNTHPHPHNMVAAGGGYMHQQPQPQQQHHPMANSNNNSNTNFSGSTSSGSSSPAIHPGGQQQQQPQLHVTFAPTIDTVTYKRSISVITNPEGEGESDPDLEVGDDDVMEEVNVPRFSQLLPDTSEGPSIASSTSPSNNPILRMAVQDSARTGDLTNNSNNSSAAMLDSPQKDNTTHQTRTPSDRLQSGRPPHHQSNPTPFMGQPAGVPLVREATTGRHQPQPLNNYPNNNNNNHQHRRHHHHPRPYNPYNFTGRLSSGSSENLPEHCIMDLKEHQLANPSSLSSCDPASDPSTSSQPSSSVNSNPLQAGQQTMLKHAPFPTPSPHHPDNDFSLEDFTASPEQTDAKIVGGGTIKEEGVADQMSGANSRVHPLADATVNDRLRKPSGASDGVGTHTNSSDKRIPHGNSGNNSVDRKRTPSGGSGGNAGVTSASERRRVPSGGGRGGENQKNSSNNSNSNQDTREGGDDDDSFGQDTEPKQLTDSKHSSSSEKPAEGDERNIECNSGDDDDTVKPRAATGNAGAADISTSDSSPSNPSRSTTYRRSQSESTTDQDATHKQPPPRSMSEEKSQKADRPIAKVKPMPASDGSVNQEPAGPSTSEELATAATEESADESSISSSAPDLHSGNPGEDADEEDDDDEEARGNRDGRGYSRAQLLMI